MSFNTGINDNQNFRVVNGRPSSRVLAPSGGQSSLSFGIAPPKKKLIEKEAEEEADEAIEPKVCGPTGKTANHNNGDQPISANAFASGSNINGAQVMTGRPTSRVLAPAGGGHTSIKLG